MKKFFRVSGFLLIAVILSCLCPSRSGAEVMLQWFESDWDEMYRRLPEVAEIGYDYLWVPSPCKAPTGKGTKWGNVGYNLYDRFDLGDIPQRGSLETRYGSRGSMRNMVDKAHQCDIKVIPDIIMNHNGNGPDFREYPGMAPEDFHVQWEENHVPGLNYKRGPRMSNWTHGEGYGATMWEELVSLIDIRTEDAPDLPDRLRFTGGNNTPGWNLVGSQPDFVRHPGQYDKYPYYPNGYTNELASEMLFRWIAWLGETMDYDGLRLDAGKHVTKEFFGNTNVAEHAFLHEAEWNFTQRRGFGDTDESDELFLNYLAERDDLLVFAEILSPWSEIRYWADWGNPMRFLDYGIKKTADGALNGSIGDFSGFGKDFGPANGIMYVWGHDEGPADKWRLGYAYILTHDGFPMVYFTGKNIEWADKWDGRTWMIPGADDYALGDDSDEITKLVWIHQQFARGGEAPNDPYADGDYLAIQRYDPDATWNSGLLLAAFNDSGWDIEHELQSYFADGTILHDYTGNFTEDWGYGSGNIQVHSGGKANVKAPGNYGQGWVCFAPLIPENLAIEFLEGGTTAAPTMDWEIPRGEHGTAYTKQIPRITDTNLTVKFTFAPPSTNTVSSCMLKWGNGANLTANTFDSGNSVVSGRFESMTPVSGTEQQLAVTITDSNIPEGLNVVKCRAFIDRPAGEPALFNTETKVVYIDRRGPEVDVTRPSHNEALYGDAVMEITNPDYTAYGMTVSVDGGDDQSAHEIMKGSWKFALRDLATGTHTALVTTTEATYGAGETRPLINTSAYSRVFSVVSNANAIAINHAHGHQQETPFFDTVVTAPGTPGLVRLYWDGYELPFNGGGYTNVFNGEVVFRDDHGRVVDDELWGNFCNGQHFFEAIRVDGGITNRTVKRVIFNLYGINAIDSDSDGIPDNIEMPGIDTWGAPGENTPWPGKPGGKGDTNYDFIENDGEQWANLNPYNHATYYNGQWDDSIDFDGDGKSNGEEVLHGYHEGSIYKYDIYDAGSTPTGAPVIASSAVGVPDPAQRGQNLLITYSPNGGPLTNSSPVHIHIGHSARTNPSWQDVTNYVMAGSAGGPWTYTYMAPANATSVDFVFRDAAGVVWDNNNGNDWQIEVQSETNRYWSMDGSAEAGYLIWSTNMHMWAAHKGESLYVATWGTSDAGGNDHFIYVTDELGYASGLAPDWSKGGQIFVDTSAKPYLGGEGDNGWNGWHNVDNGSSADADGGRLEGEFNLVDAFGYVPDYVYICSVSHATGDGADLNSQSPHAWNTDNNVDVMELLRVPLASIRDNDLDGYHDVGSPQMWTVVGNSTNDANFGLRRFFIDEMAGDTSEITIIIEPNPGGTNEVTDVELFSNINRRDFAVMEEDFSTVDSENAANYYRAYPMTEVSAGRFSKTLVVRKCGAYRINARYRVNGGDYAYYTDSGLRRDCAVVVSPAKALETTMYEVNPMFIEATNDTFRGRSTFEDMVAVNTDRPDRVNTDYFKDLGANMLWLQPIHPIGVEGRQTDPATGSAYDPGSPYAVRDYWQVNEVLGNPASTANAMMEFQTFVSAMDQAGVGVMLDGTFNHSAWDCQIGVQGVEMGITTNPSELIRAVRPQWYSRKNQYGEQATHYEHAGAHDLAVAPDRFDFGKWDDACDFHFGTYDALVQDAPADTNNWWPSPWARRFLLEEDRFDGHDAYTREVWEYFTAYPAYWLEKTGHPEGTSPTESHKGIDGLRCDFAQGLPSHFWEYCINKTRSIKWDFLFMAESLDGYSEVAGSKRHGVGFRSSRHFDILNENLVFYWRNQFFNYPAYGYGSGSGNDAPTTAETIEAMEDRRDAYESSPLLLNLSSHDEVYPSHDPWRLFYAYAQLSAVDGVPMMLYGQELGAQNDHVQYHLTNSVSWIPDDSHNFARYELNFGKSIPNFKRYNHMVNIWENTSDYPGLLEAYQRCNAARLASPALQSTRRYFLNETGDGNPSDSTFAVAKFEEPGISAATQDVVFAFVNNHYWNEGYSNVVGGVFDVGQTYEGNNHFGIMGSHEYNVVDLLSTNPAAYLWSSNKLGSTIISTGMGVLLDGDPAMGLQAQYIKLVDMTDAGPGDSDSDGLNDWQDDDDDNDGLPDWWEEQHGLSSTSGTGDDGPNGDKDKDGMSNLSELRAGTNPNDETDFLEVNLSDVGGAMQIQWSAKPDFNYQVEQAEKLLPADWEARGPLRTATSTLESEMDYGAGSATSRYYRVKVKP